MTFRLTIAGLAFTTALLAASLGAQAVRADDAIIYLPFTAARAPQDQLVAPRTVEPPTVAPTASATPTTTPTPTRTATPSPEPSPTEPRPSVTPQTPTPTSPPTPSATPPRMPPAGTVFEDAFCNDQSGWPEDASATVDYGYIDEAGDCEYRIRFKAADRLFNVTPQLSAVSFIVEASVRHASATPGGEFGMAGLMFGLSDDWETHYDFLITTDGRFGLAAYNSGEWQLLVPFQATTVFDPQAETRLRVEVLHRYVSLYANEQLLATMEHERPFPGRVGLASQTSYAGYEARFDDFSLATIKNQGPVRVLDNHSAYEEEDGDLVIFGEIENGLAESLRFLSATVYLYDRQGRLVTTKASYTPLDALPGGDKTCFAVTIENVPLRWDRYDFDVSYWEDGGSLPAFEILSDRGYYDVSLDRYVVEGRVKNMESTRVERPSLVMTLYDIKRNVVGCDSDYLSDMGPGDEQDFGTYFYRGDPRAPKTRRYQMDGDLR